MATIRVTFRGKTTRLRLDGLTKSETFSDQSNDKPELLEIKLNGQPTVHITGTQYRSIALDKDKKTATIEIVTPPLVTGGRSKWASSNGYAFQVVVSAADGLQLHGEGGDLGWLRKKAWKAIGPIDQFCTLRAGRPYGNHKQIEVEPFPYGDLDFIKKYSSRKKGSELAALGLFSRGDAELYIVVILSRTMISNTGGFTIRKIGDEAEKQLKYLTRKDERVMTCFNVFPLSLTSSWVTAWHADSDKGLLPFLKAHQSCVDGSRTGLWHARNDIPWVVNPAGTKTTSGALYFFGGHDNRKYWRDVLPVSEDGKARKVTLEYDWKHRGGGEPRKYVFDATLENVELAAAEKDEKLDPLDFGKGQAIRDQLLLRAARLGKASSDGAVEVSVNTTITHVPAVPKTASLESFGAFNLGFGRSADDQSGNESPTVALRLRSGPNPDLSGLFASSTTKMMPVDVEFGCGADPKERFSVFDLATSREEAMHSDTDAIVRSFANKTPVIKATLDIETEARYGSRESVSLTLRTKDKNTTPPRMSFFQAKPFLYAAIDDVERDREGGTILARWQSADGGQWRMAYHTATLQLPAQAVGEEMERGERFWTNPEQSYIGDEQPIRYRFSPPTQIVISPDSGRRRFNPVPNNVFRLVNRGGVQSFQTELIYPISTRYARSEDATIDVRISETSEFIGTTVPNLPVDEGIEPEDTQRLTQSLFEGDLPVWARGNWAQSFRPSYKELRLNNSAAKANFAARIAQLNLWNGNARNESLVIREDLQFELRSHQMKGQDTIETPVIDPDGGAPTPPLMNPLPVMPVSRDVIDVPPGPNSRDRITDFLLGKADWDQDGSRGGIRGGVIHSIEYPSELVAVLRHPHSRSGWLGNVSFSNLGATGSVEVAFDEGRTIFTAEVENGQISRLLRTRIGRIGITWSRAKHIIVYERTVLPSQQFDSQQKKTPHPGWPILRKTEEYIEPIDVVRDFASESDADRSKAGFLNEFEFVSQRIYVDSAWGEELDGAINGYKIPLWDGGLSRSQADTIDEDHDGGRANTSWFYPKPKLAFVSRGEDGAAVRQWIDDPDELFFYTNTVEGAGGDPDAWPAVAGVDAPKGVSRIGVLSKMPDGRGWTDFIGKRAQSSPPEGRVKKKEL